jgi:hypothetical protein
MIVIIIMIIINTHILIAFSPGREVGQFLAESQLYRPARGYGRVQAEAAATAPNPAKAPGAILREL